MQESKERQYIEILDTVLLLPFRNKEDIFVFLDDMFIKKSKLNISFSTLRKGAEEVVKSCCINDIYLYIQNVFSVDEEICDALKKYEISLWKKYLLPRESFFKYYSQNKDNVEFCFVNNIGIDSELLTSIIKELGYKEEVIDYSGAEVGTNIIKWVKPLDIFDGKVNTDIKCNIPEKIAFGNLISSINSVDKSIGYGALKTLVANNFFDDVNVYWKPNSVINCDAYKCGYYLLGMHLLGIVKWIVSIIKDKHTQKNRIFFTARDGYIVMKAYDEYRKIHPELPEAKYIQASRKLLLPFLYSTPLEFYESPNEYSYYSPRLFIKWFWLFTKYAETNDFDCKSMNCKEEIIKNLLDKECFFYEKKFESYQEYCRFVNWFIQNMYSKENHSILKNRVKKYYSDIKDNDILFDLGYSGKIPKCISDIIDCKLDILFILSDEIKSQLIQSNSKITIHSFYDHMTAFENGLREFIMSENTSSCIGLTEEKEKIVPVYETYLQKYLSDLSIETLQKGALDYVSNVYSLFGEDIDTVPFKSQEVSMAFEGFFRDIPEEDIAIFKDSVVYDGLTDDNTVSSMQDFFRYVSSRLTDTFIPQDRTLSLNIEKYVLSNMKLAFWGTGKICGSLLEKMGNIKPQILLDNSDIEERIKYGINVYNPNEVSIKDYFIVIATKYYEEISKQLEEYNLVEGKDFIWYKQIL